MFLYFAFYPLKQRVYFYLFSLLIRRIHWFALRRYCLWLAGGAHQFIFGFVFLSVCLLKKRIGVFLGIYDRILRIACSLIRIKVILFMLCWGCSSIHTLSINPADRITHWFEQDRLDTCHITNQFVYDCYISYISLTDSISNMLRSRFTYEALTSPYFV